ncbi:MAG: CRTAC1 family protein [Acidobacteria bacterium]|nr:MAG: CRTAC1 family protein [Acidobacteriota bacterium]
MQLRMTRFGMVVLGFFLSLACLAQAPPVPRFEEVSKQAGLTVSHNSSPEKRYIIESMSGGVGFIDCDNDGKLDIISVNGSSVDRYRQSGDPMVTLYRQDGDLKFKDITQQAGLTRKGWGMGVAVADFDNDGRQDVYVTGYGGNVLYRNRGNCRFEDVTEKAGVRMSGLSTGAAWGDFDRDGHVDLFVPRYVFIDINKLPEFGSNEKFCRFRGIMVQCGPWGLPGESDFLFRNRGDGTFEDVSRKAGVDDPEHYYGMQGVWADYDNDGWPDLYVSNDAGPNYLYHNKHDGTFEDVGLLSGAALSADGREQGSMGVDLGDIDHNGNLDIFVTNFAEEPNTLYWNQGMQGFTDISWASRLAQPSYSLVGWGTAFFDMDNDGWADILVANGHVYPQMDLVKGGAPYRQPLLLFRNNRDRTFEDVTALSGLDKLPPSSRRGAAFGDINNDGKVDVLILNVGEPPTLLINRTQTAGHAVLFKLVGSKSNKAAIGARVTVTAGDLVQFEEVRGGSSYLSQNDLRLHFGLGQQTNMSAVEISWPSGKEEKFRNLPADFIYTIVEDGGVQQKIPFSEQVGGKKQTRPGIKSHWRQELTRESSPTR